jgi:hypothetical protein
MVKEGEECLFMTKAGCTYNGGSCHPIVEQCEGCERVVTYHDQRFCRSYPNPSVKWKTGKCNFATHMKASGQNQQKINPLKASKRNNKKK